MATAEINELAAKLKTFLELFDAYFLDDEHAEELFLKTKTSLNEKISHNEAALPVIYAMGGRYNSEIDRAKVKEIDALIRLLQARKEVRKATIEEADKENENKELLKTLFGL